MLPWTKATNVLEKVPSASPAWTFCQTRHFLMITIKNGHWDRLRAVAAAARRKFPVDREAGRHHAGMGCMGLILEPRLRHGGYWCTPTNSLSFAWNGGGGTHFSFLVQNNRVHNRSPIICTVPEPADQHNFIVGENLNDFLSLGYYLGYFGLEQLAFDLDRTLQAFTSPNWKPETETDYLVGRASYPDSAPVHEFFRKKLELSPWKGGKRRFNSLQRRFMSRLKYSEQAKELMGI
jgi:hypothetical protein